MNSGLVLVRYTFTFLGIKLNEEFEEKLKEQFSQLTYENFHALLSVKKLFVCGGEMDAAAHPSISFRNQFLTFTAENNVEFDSAIVCAEEFKDYYKNDNYNDLVTFEDDIASLSTLVIIFLESPGSLVELGLYCSRKQYHKKLLVVAPENKVSDEDSFIFLGPLKYIEKSSEDSVVIYSFPEKNVDFDNATTDDLCSAISLKIDKSNDIEKFITNNSCHLAHLIAEIVRLCFPIQIGEIETCFKSLKIEFVQSQVKRLLYLLEKLNFLNHIKYSSNTYYFPTDPDERLMSFGRTKNEKTLESSKLFISIRQSFVLNNHPNSKRRQNVLKKITKKIIGVL